MTAPTDENKTDEDEAPTIAVIGAARYMEAVLWLTFTQPTPGVEQNHHR
jgi:hypothetical protein